MSRAAKRAAVVPSLEELMEGTDGDDDEILYQERQQKILEYETFINERLKVDLDLTLEDRDKIYAELGQYLELKNHILLIKEQNLDTLSTMVNLSSEFFVQAKVEDTSKIFVHVGLGFHPELTLDEALAFIDEKEKHMNERADKITKEANQIRLRIRMMYDALEQLVNLPAPKKLQRNIF